MGKMAKIMQVKVRSQINYFESDIRTVADPKIPRWGRRGPTPEFGESKIMMTPKLGLYNLKPE